MSVRLLAGHWAVLELHAPDHRSAARDAARRDLWLHSWTWVPTATTGGEVELAWRDAGGVPTRDLLLVHRPELRALAQVHLFGRLAAVPRVGDPETVVLVVDDAEDPSAREGFAHAVSTLVGRRVGVIGAQEAPADVLALC